ncbi:MAG: hypothetical protein U1C58_11995 [Flavobacteriaceae bacterium]|nr:hypothetical protein [Flavobacteriaceae bacterium]MDZ4149001.1 hypothetical protein [Flavobacteriaceae bacterium]
MKLSEFENIIREKFQHRTINPSENTWSRLENKLIKQTKQRRLRFVFRAVAASIVLFASVGLIIKNQIVTIPKNQIVEISKPFLTPEIRKETIPKESEGKTVFTTENRDKIDPNLNPKKSNPVAVTEAINAQKQIEKPLEKPESKNIIDQKVDEVVAKILDIQKNKSTFSDAEINSLLTDALKDIKTQQLLNRATGKVDATALLADVEDEIDHSFKEKVLLALRESYQTVKTAVVQSNN